MNKFILTSLLLILFLGIVTSSDFKVVSGNKKFKTSKGLYGTYIQQMKDSDGGYHKAEIYFKTNISSFNPDRSGVENIECKRDENDKKKISFDLKNRKAINTVKRWPSKVMLLVSHKWKCFDKKTTQFFMVTNRVIDESKKIVTFDAEDCEVSDWSNEYAINVDWVEQNNSTNLDKFHFPHIPIPHLPHPHIPIPHLPKPHLPFPSINKAQTLSLNALFDEQTGNSSKPNITLINKSGIKLLCANCYTTGEATMSLSFAGNIVPPRLTAASITLNGNLKLNIDLALEATEKNPVKFGNSPLITIPFDSIDIPRLFNAGPELDLVAAADVGATVGTLEFGGDLNLPNFNIMASFNNLPPTFKQSGFTPKVNPHPPQVNDKVTVDISGSLIPQLAVGINILNGRVLNQRVGFEIAGNLDNSLTFEPNNTCKSGTPFLESTLDFSLGFFADKQNFNILTSPGIPLIHKCLP